MYLMVSGLAEARDVKAHKINEDTWLFMSFSSDYDIEQYGMEELYDMVIDQFNAEKGEDSSYYSDGLMAYVAAYRIDYPNDELTDDFVDYLNNCLGKYDIGGARENRNVGRMIRALCSNKHLEDLQIYPD